MVISAGTKEEISGWSHKIDQFLPIPPSESTLEMRSLNFDFL
jgi:hypothetical protein